MVKQVPYFEDSTGYAHKTELAAWKADLAIWIERTEVVNETTAKQLAERICTDRQAIAEMQSILTNLEHCMPYPVETETVSA